MTHPGAGAAISPLLAPAAIARLVLNPARICHAPDMVPDALTRDGSRSVQITQPTAWNWPENKVASVLLLLEKNTGNLLRFYTHLDKQSSIQGSWNAMVSGCCRWFHLTFSTFRASTNIFDLCVSVDSRTRINCTLPRLFLPVLGSSCSGGALSTLMIACCQLQSFS